MTKATAGERFAAKFYGMKIRSLAYCVKSHPAVQLAKAIDRAFFKRDAKVAEDVLAMVANTPPYVTFDKIAEEVRAKYGKGKR